MRSATTGIDRRRADLERADLMTIGLTRVTGFVDIQGAGEVAVEIEFPVWFTEKPSASFGGELAEGHSAEATNFPTISIVILRWITATRGLGTYYSGAVLGVVTTGVSDHGMIAHYQLEGKAMQNPVAPTGQADEAI